MKIAFIGLGSIAKRHIKNLKEVLTDRNVDFSIDVFRHSDGEINDEEIRSIVSGVYNEKELAKYLYDIIFITNPTSLHFATIKKAAKQAKHLFIEKPVFDTTDVNLNELELQEDSVYYVACPLRYTAVLQYVKEHVNLDDVFSVRAISSSYLPDWRPGTDYRKTYSANKDLGGGVAIDLIHEWDYLTAFFGFPEKTYGIETKVSALEITSNDLAAYIGVYKDKIIELHLDYFGRKTTRQMVLYTKDETIVADLTESKITYQKEGKVINFAEDRNAFQKRELCHFLDMIDGKTANDNTVANALRVLKLADSADKEV